MLCRREAQDLFIWHRGVELANRDDIMAERRRRLFGATANPDVEQKPKS